MSYEAFRATLPERVTLLHAKCAAARLGFWLDTSSCTPRLVPLEPAHG